MIQRRDAILTLLLVLAALGRHGDGPRAALFGPPRGGVVQARRQRGAAHQDHLRVGLAPTPALFLGGLFIFAFGGRVDQRKIVDTIECYDISKNVWQERRKAREQKLSGSHIITDNPQNPM